MKLAEYPPVIRQRVLALRDLNLDVGHAVLIVYDGDTPLLLDNQIKTVRGIPNWQEIPIDRSLIRQQR